MEMASGPMEPGFLEEDLPQATNAPILHLVDPSEPFGKTTANFILNVFKQHKNKSCILVVPTERAAKEIEAEVESSTNITSRVQGDLTITTPSQLFEQAISIPGIARHGEMLTAMLAALFEVEPFAESALFPNDTFPTAFEQRLSLATMLLDLRSELATGDLDCTLVALRTQNEPVEHERWQELAHIEKAYRKHLHHRKKVDRSDKLRQWATDPHFSSEIDIIVLAGIVEAEGIFFKALHCWHTEHKNRSENSIHILAFSSRPLITNPHTADEFDAWGRLNCERWQTHTIPWSNFAQHVHLVGQPQAIPKVLANLIPKKNQLTITQSAPTLAILEPSLIPYIFPDIAQRTEVLEDQNIRCLLDHWMSRLLQRWRIFLEDATFDESCQLLRHPALTNLFEKTFSNFDITQLLKELDTIRANHFPSTVTCAIQLIAHKNVYPIAARALAWLHNERQKFFHESFHSTLNSFLDRILHASIEVARSDSSSIAELTSAFEAIKQASVHSSEEHTQRDLAHHTPAAQLQRLLVSLKFLPLPESARHKRTEIATWQELPWLDAAHVTLVGAQEGSLPESIPQNPFLSAGMRKKLNLLTQEKRFARDAYYLDRIVSQSETDLTRTVDVIVCQESATGDPLQPSRLLFLTEPSNIANHVQVLFHEPPASPPEPAWHAGWKLTLPQIARLQRIRVTAFKAYLDCPFGFYLKHGLRLDEQFLTSPEMTHLQFGTLIHSVLEAFGNNPTFHKETNEHAIYQIVCELLDVYVRREFGTSWTLPLTIQIETARQRLRAFANIQAALQQEGWEIVAAERTFREQLQAPFELDGIEITGTFDRLDFHPPSGRWRVIDYKTSAKGTCPEKTHLRSDSARYLSWPPSYAHVCTPNTSKCSTKQKGKVWRDLQLPLYRHVLIQSGLPETSIECAYFTLPKAAMDASILLWEDFSPELAHATITCTQGVIASIQAHHFWPPNPNAEFPYLEHWMFPEPTKVFHPVTPGFSIY